MAGEFAAASLPPANAPRAAQQDAVERLAQRLGADVSLYDADAALIARAGAPLPPPTRERGGPVMSLRGPAWSFRLPGGRVLMARAAVQQRHSAVGFVFFLGSIALIVAACAYPVARGLTRRLERLQAGVETLGGGDLSARVKVEGRDEV